MGNRKHWTVASFSKNDPPKGETIVHHLRLCLAAINIASLLTVAMTAASSAPATDELVIADLEDDHQLSMEFETPHTDWAQPYALGKVRLLYFGFAGYDRGIEARDLIELMQRFDIEPQAAYHHTSNRHGRTWFGGNDRFLPCPTGEERIARLLTQPWDCFVFHGIPTTVLRAEAQDKVLKAVTRGAGLVLIGCDEDEVLKRCDDDGVLKPENKVSELPPFLANDPVGDAYRLERGRAIRLPDRPQIAYRPGWEVDYDYWVERVGRAVLWAANKSPRVNMTIACEAAHVDRLELADQCVEVQCETADSLGSLALEVRLRRSDGTVFRLHSTPEGPTTFPFEQRHRAGHYHVDAIARSNSGVETWATVPIEITTSRTVEAIELDEDWGEVGETIVGTARLGGQPVADETVRVQLLDSRQRVLVQADKPVTDSTASFEFAIEDWMPMVLEVRTLVMEGNEDVSSGYTYFRVTKRNRGQFNFVVWDHPIDTLAPYAEEQLARLGCTVQLPLSTCMAPARSSVVAASNIAVIPYITRILTKWDEDGYMDPVCWNDEPAVDEWVDSIVSIAKEGYRQHGAFVYSLGDEGATKGSCVHPACLDAYRRYLEQEYGDVAVLNESWGSNYASFDAVSLLVAGDNDEAEALRQKMYPRWYDRQAFKGYSFARLCERFGKQLKKIDPEARTGFEGAGGFADGTDIDLICRTNDFWTPYPGTADEIIRSITDRHFIRSTWMGYWKDADTLLGQYWRMVTRGADSIWWWMWEGLGGYRGLIAPHMAPWPHIKEMQHDTRIVRDGLGSLLLKCRREDDGIAILYSYPSTFANKIEAGPSYGGYETAHKAWHRALRALGLQFSYVTDRMLRRGEFRPWLYKVLILPQTEAIGPREAEVIRAFAEAGGMVIADVRPGLYDHHCKRVEAGILDDLFGIERTGSEKAAEAQAEIHGMLGSRPVAVSFDDAQVDATLRPTSGQAMGSAGGTALCIVNEVGRGGTVLLNFTMPSFPRINVGQAPSEAADFVAGLLAVAGVEPQVTVTDLAGNPIRDTEVIRWKGPGVDFLALFGGAKLGVPVPSLFTIDFTSEDEVVEIHLPHPRHVYDLREHAYRGRTATFKLHKMPRRATFVALSPRQLSGPQMQLPGPEVARGQQLTVTLWYPESRADHAARLRVYQPDGSRAEWLDQVAIVSKEGAAVTLPIAYNDPVGVWTIQAIDLYTNEVAKAKVKVE